jgi:hypothetical protein
MRGNGSSTQAQYSNDTYIASGITAQWTNTTRNQTTIHFFDYARTDKHKTILARADVSSLATEATASRWAQTAAITSIAMTLNPGTSSFATGSTFALYGVIA